MYSEYLRSRHDLCRKLVDDLAPKFEYVSVMGKHIVGDRVNVSTQTINVAETGEKQCGFVVKLYNGRTYSEYSFSDITEEKLAKLEAEIVDSIKLPDAMLEDHVDVKVMSDEPLVKDFVRESTGREFTVPELVERLGAIKDKVHAVSEKIIQVYMIWEHYDVSSMFISKNRDLTQNYTWSYIYGIAMARDGEKISETMEVSAYDDQEKVLAGMEEKATKLGQFAVDKLKAEIITPGVYDIITAPSITGLIAHEAFGHGVEMDMFVKKRAKSRHYINKPVASPLVEMHDGAAACNSCIGYFFDDDGVLAHDTLIIKEGILQTGISDAISAMQLGTEPTGNGRRQDPSRKAYTRMTNTFFAPGHDKLEDMIASIEHGYMLFQTDNGMEDPKNWNIQCVAEYGLEIKGGKFTGRIVAPVVMSGYVPDLLKSISMVSDEWEVIGAGHCGKGYKEWVPVSDGGPYLKCRCRLG